MTIDIQNVTAVQNEQQQGIIGHLTWYSVSEHLVSREELHNKLITSGLDEGWMPNEIRSSDAFRRATKSIETRKATSQSNIYENYLVREVYSDKDMIQRNIVCEVVDQKGKRLDYDGQAAIMILDKTTDTINIKGSSKVAQELAQEAKKLFHIYKNNYSAQTLRVMCMNIMKSLSPTPVRPNGGVYFIPSAHTDQLTKWSNFVNSLEKGESFKVPLVNSLDNRQMVNRKLKEHLNGILNECKNSLNGDLKKWQVKNLIEEAKRVIGDYNQYKSIVVNDVDELENYIDLIREQVTIMVESM